jgi:hypothetical protein
MIYIWLNITAILLATLAGLAIGAVWYRDVLFPRTLGPKPRWMAIFATASLAEFWLACILAGALILAPSQASVWTMTIGSAVIIWVGFVLPVIWATYALRKLGWRKALSDSGHWLAVMLVQAVVLRLIGLVAPGV